MLSIFSSNYHVFSPCISARVIKRAQQSHCLPEATPIQPHGDVDHVQGNSFGLEVSTLSWVGRKASCLPHRDLRAKNVKLAGTQDHSEAREATMVQFTQQQRNKMTPLSQQLESKYLTEILNTTPRGRANEEQRKLKQDIEATKTQSA